ncbi:hypothetical protein VNG72_23455 [Acidiphilium acidophilum]|nr:hypothetical protein [Acidiphilium acidophilum]
MMDLRLLWLMAIVMGVYQGFNPPIAWLRAVGNGLEARSSRAVLRTTSCLAFGHFMSMVVFLVPIAIGVAELPASVLSMQTIMRVGWALSLTLIGFGVFKVLRPHHPRFIARIRPDQPIRWSFCMGIVHCGSPVMMVPALISLITAGAWISTFHMSSTAKLAGATMVALMLGGTMSLALFFTGSVVAVAVYRRLGLRAITRYWINLDLGWALMFIAMGLMGLLMG